VTYGAKAEATLQTKEQPEGTNKNKSEKETEDKPANQDQAGKQAGPHTRQSHDSEQVQVKGQIQLRRQGRGPAGDKLRPPSVTRTQEAGQGTEVGRAKQQPHRKGRVQRQGRKQWAMQSSQVRVGRSECEQPSDTRTLVRERTYRGGKMS